MKKILVAIDGSDMSLKVLTKARQIADKFEAEVLVMTVVKKLRVTNYYTGGELNEQMDKQVENSAKKILESAQEIFQGYKGKLETILDYGEPAEEILVLAEREKPDLLIMGSRGLGGFSRVMLGSVSTKVLHHVTCDMLIVRNEK
ncbi:universal stress protein [Tindallia californiensis]|uniref:Universal stress protein n=1 Tax=Tindallia californiensis TaxID=159292 RepID=A0A1H3IL97_9FIRM|nr:universal stress protein [Tindallia californiensis]SDY28613.1 Nucleotide-binding universal stress protein, UspA family [Tindallia californiensis]